MPTLAYAGWILALDGALAEFVVVHLRWGAGPLMSVVWAGAVLSVLFVLAHGLGACVPARVAVDAVGLLVVPVAMARRRIARSEGTS